MRKFQIGDIVRVREYNDIPEEYQTTGVAKMCSEVGTVADVFYSESQGAYLYLIQFENFKNSTKLWREELLEKNIDDVKYAYEIECLDNIVLARLYELRGDSKTEIARGHGHIIHEGVLGVSQAASYAIRRIFYEFNKTEYEYEKD
jgi:hypothetical protein